MLPPPYMVELRITKECNLKCLHCPFRYKAENPSELSKDIWLKVVQDAAELGVEKCTITGGEAMCKPDITLSIMEAIKKHGMIGMLITNGTLFTEEIIKKIIEIGWDVINFSIDGPNAEINDYIRGEGTFDRVVTNIKAFVFWKKKLRKNLPTLNIMPVITNKNYNKIVDMVKLCKELKVSGIYLQQLVVHHSSAKELSLNDEQLKELPTYLSEAKEIAEKIGMNTNLNEFVDQVKLLKITENFVNKEKFKPKENVTNEFSTKPYCFFPWSFMGVREDGRVEPCPTDSYEEKSPENVKEKSLKKIWYGEYFNSIRKKLVEGLVLKRCERCCPGNIVQDEQKRRGVDKDFFTMESTITSGFSIVALEAIRKKLREIDEKIKKEYEEKLREREYELRRLRMEIEKNRKLRDEERGKLEKEKKELSIRYGKEIKAKDEEIEKLRGEIAKLNENYRMEIEKRKEEIEKLREKIGILEDELKRIQESISYKIVKKIWFLKNLIKR